MEYFVYLADAGMQVFLCFQDDKEVGMQVFRMRRRSKWNVLQMWGLRRRRGEPSEEGTCTVLCELQGIYTVACERDLHVGAPLMSI
jgi:hypothetical protein